MTHNYNLRNLSQRQQEKSSIFLNSYNEYINKKEDIIEIEIKLKLLNGKQYDFTVNKNITLKELFTKTSVITNINYMTFYFVKNRCRFPKFEEIEDWMTLKDFNFKYNDSNILHLVLRLGGPMEPFNYNKKEWFDNQI